MAQVSQADVTGFRWIKVSTALLGRLAAPTDGFASGTNPDFTLSPFAPSKQSTTGFQVMLKLVTGSAAAPVAGGYNVTVWLRDPATGFWAAFAVQTIDYSQLFVTYDIDASQIYFQIDGATVGVAGSFYIGIAEQ